MNQNFTIKAPKRWYVAEWPPLAWLETAIKTVAIILGIVILVDTLSNGSFIQLSGLRLIQFITFGILCFGLILAIIDRFIEREIIAMAFVIINNLGHWGILLALITSVVPTTLLITFCSLMLIGDIVKVIFLKTSNFCVRNTPPSVLYILTSIYIVGYAATIILELM